MQIIAPRPCHKVVCYSSHLFGVIQICLGAHNSAVGLVLLNGLLSLCNLILALLLLDCFIVGPYY